MLELKGIRKVYPAGGENVTALKGIDLCFRKSEFVSILGPSGCGKTTMLNIIGGLDQYTAGDLIINGRSTRDFRDRDWDAYRNHAIGFVFQSYNLIPHQTVLQNVELALTLSGVSKAERRRRAKEALEQVGLSSQLRKRPSEMSGGQMQRVAIARAIVNNPDIILADEPTGALDTETSVQVMDILKEISRDRLVIMVTHNPDLAQRYSTRIINMLDGAITGDSAPLSEEETAAERQAEAEKAQTGRKKKPSMSFATAFGLSLKNLFTKKGRTLLTSFAGSIGIIGIALIYAVSQGMTTYIDTVQEETLSSYPLTLQAQEIDAGSLLSTFMGTAEDDVGHGMDAVYEKGILYKLVNAMNSLEATTNDLAGFKAYLESCLADENDQSGLRAAVSGVQYGYPLELPVYTESVSGQIIVSDSITLMQELFAGFYGMDLSAGSMTGVGSSASPLISMMASGNSNSYVMWEELLPGDSGAPVSDLVMGQYDLVWGAWPNQYDQIVLVLDEHNELNDMTLYALGLMDRATIDDNMMKAFQGIQVDGGDARWTYEEICARTYRVVLPSDAWVQDEATGRFTDLRATEAGLSMLYAGGLELHVSGIIRPREDAIASMLRGSVGYTSLLTDYVIAHAQESAVVRAQQANPAVDVFTGLPFRANGSAMTEAEKAASFRAIVAGMSPADKAAAFAQMISTPTEADVDAAVAQTIGGMTRADMEAALVPMAVQQTGMSETMIRGYLGGMSDENLMTMVTEGIREQVKAQAAQAAQARLAAMDEAAQAAALDQALPDAPDALLAASYDALQAFSDATPEGNLALLGCVDAGNPSSIRLYAASFEKKDVIEAAIAAYNAARDEVHRIAYTDYVGLMMSSVTTIINAITYVLIAFVAISLIVSSIMIGVITLISVQERTKEIGILRAIGASKRNVSSMFNAETVIIGFASGAVGVGITYLLCIPINLILHSLTGINNLSAILPVPTALILIAISMLLTLISGVIPSRSAAKKDPVVALRTE